MKLELQVKETAELMKEVEKDLEEKDRDIAGITDHTEGSKEVPKI